MLKDEKGRRVLIENVRTLRLLSTYLTTAVTFNQLMWHDDLGRHKIWILNMIDHL